MGAAKMYLSTLLGVTVFSLKVTLEDDGRVVESPITGLVNGVSDAMLIAKGRLVALAESDEAVVGSLGRGGSIRITQVSRPHTWNVVYPAKVVLEFQALYGVETSELMRLLAEDFAVR